VTGKTISHYRVLEQLGRGVYSQCRQSAAGWGRKEKWESQRWSTICAPGAPSAGGASNQPASASACR